LTVGEASDEKAESDQGSQDGHHALFSESKPWGIETIVGSGWSGHLAEGGHVGGGLRVCRFGVTQTPVGGLANGPKGIPVLRTDTASDAEVTRITDDGLGTQRSSLFEILLEPRGLVVTAQGGIHSPVDDSGAESARSTRVDPAMKNQCDLIRAAHIEMIPDHSFKPHPTRLRPVEYAGVGNF
jgi:hypothetical protein